jgi:hypothetical protein
MTPNYPDYDKIYPPIPYTAEEVQRLIDLFESRMPKDAGPDYPESTLTEYFKNRIYSGVFQGNATKERKERFMQYVEKEYYDIYKAMFIDKIEDMPLLINNRDLDLVAQWRLEIAK